jgi:hypothetical protein
MPEYNHYYDDGHELRPYRTSSVANKGSMPPRNATRTAPPAEKEGKWPCFADGAWVYVDDHRGEIGYVGGKRTEIRDIGPYPDGWSAQPPPPTAEEVREAAIDVCLMTLNGLDAKSTRSMRAIEVLRARLADGEDAQAELDGELAFLADLEGQARDERAKLAALMEGRPAGAGTA